MSMGIQPEELIAQYCDLKRLTRAVEQGAYDQVRRAADSTMKKIFAEKPDDETLALLVNCLFVVLQYHVFYGFLDRAKLTLGETYADRAAMRRDWDAWQAGQALGDEKWLSKPDDKVRVFEAIAALNLTADDFDEYPAPEIKEPKWQKKTFGEFELVTIADAEITDDGGLFASPNPVGKDFVLHDADGVTYYLYHVRKSDSSALRS